MYTFVKIEPPEFSMRNPTHNYEKSLLQNESQNDLKSRNLTFPMKGGDIENGTKRLKDTKGTG